MQFPVRNPLTGALVPTEFGEPRRSFRERGPLAGWPALTIGLIGVAAIFLVLILGGRWGFLLVLPLAVVTAAGSLAWIRYAPVPGAAGRRLVVVADGGLVVRGDTATGYPWEAVRAFHRLPAGGRFGYVLVVDPAPVHFAHFDGGGALLRSVANRRAEPVPVAGRAAAGVALLVAAGLFAWFLVVPRFRPEHRAQLPAGLSGFSVVCGSPGVAFTRAAPYSGATGPHPMAVIDETFTPLSRRLATTLPTDRQPAVGEVQLVACARRDNLNQGPTCPDGFPAPRYDVTVYEARTHRTLARRALTADCGLDPRAEPGSLVFGITTEQYARELGDLVH